MSLNFPDSCFRKSRKNPNENYLSGKYGEEKENISKLPRELIRGY